MNRLQQRGFKRDPRRSPTQSRNTLQLGKVIKTDPAAKTVDVCLIDCSGTYYNVPVLASFTSSSSGISHLPEPHSPKEQGESGHTAPIGYDKRDIYAIIGFIEGNGVFPVVLGFKHPEKNQMSFSEPNQKVERHEGDRYHRITGDTVAENGGQDVPGEEEIRYPDHSYFKVVKKGGSRDLTDLFRANRDSEEMPFQLKKDGAKGFYFQHASGSRIYIGHDGEIKVSHKGGSWVSIGPDTGDLAPATAGGTTIDSKNDPPGPAGGDTPQVHIGHPSGTYLTIDGQGTITAFSDSIKLGSGTVRKLLDERTHTYLNSFVGELNAWLNAHNHSGTGTPIQTAALTSPPVIAKAATTNTVAS